MNSVNSSSTGDSPGCVGAQGKPGFLSCSECKMLPWR